MTQAGESFYVVPCQPSRLRRAATGLRRFVLYTVLRRDPWRNWTDVGYMDETGFSTRWEPKA